MPDPTREHPLVRRLSGIVPLSEEERRALAALPMTVKSHPAKKDIVREGDRPGQCCLLLEGMTCRHKTLGEGKRQIMAFHVAGDIPDLQSLHLKVMDHSIGTITPVKAGFIRHEHMHALIAAHPRLGDAFWRDTLIDGAIFREWMIGIGRKEALGRIAHLLCELFVKMRAVDLTQGTTCPLPITQSEFADALGLSAVHVNRVLQELRGLELITLTRSTLAILDWEGLARVSEFDPLYLHQDPHEMA